MYLLASLISLNPRWAIDLEWSSDWDEPGDFGNLIKVIDFGLAHRPEEPDFGLSKWKAIDSTNCLYQDVEDLSAILCEIKHRSKILSRERESACLVETCELLRQEMLSRYTKTK
jgi:hypothetical protein